MSSNATIEKGPFAGTQIDPARLMSNSETGELYWGTHDRTPIFLERFPPREGWQVVIEYRNGNYNLPDLRNSTLEGQVLNQPADLFIAKLINAAGQVVAQASKLAIINGPDAWEAGETQARGRLYDALGLPGSSRQLHHGHPTIQATSSQSVQGGSASAAVAILPLGNRDSARATSKQSRPVSVSAPASTEESDSGQASAQDSKDLAESSSEPVSSREKAPARNAPKQSGALDQNLLEQIRVQAELQGVEIPSFADNAEARAFFKRLLKKDPSLTGRTS